MTATLHTRPTLHGGKRPPSGKPAISFGVHRTGVAINAPIVDTDLDKLHLTWPMDNNDQWGDCVVAGWDHFCQAVDALLGVAYTNLTDAEILALYRTQNPDFDPNSDTNGPGSNADGGMDIQTLLAYLVKQGKILGFAKVDHTNEAEMRDAIWLGLAIVTGETLTRKNMSEKVWDYHAADPEEGGHCTVTVEYLGDPDDDEQVSWGALYGMTQAFLAKRVDEAWLIITQAHVNNPSFRAGFDLTSFAAAYKQLTGRDFPAVTPVPTPAPGGGASFQLDAAVEPHVAHAAQLAHLSEQDWINRHFHGYFRMSGSATAETGAPVVHLDVFEGDDQQWYVGLVWANGQPFMTSEGYSRREDAERAAHDGLPGLPVN